MKIFLRIVAVMTTALMILLATSGCAWAAPNVAMEVGVADAPLQPGNAVVVRLSSDQGVYVGVSRSYPGGEYVNLGMQAQPKE